MRALFALLDPRGRLSRSAYGRRLIRLLLAACGIACLAIVTASLGLRAAALAIASAGLVGVAAAATAATARRLHDRDRTAWWLLPNAVVSAAGFAPIEAAADAYPLAVIAATLAMTGFSLWFVIETLGRRGTATANRPGPQP